jgi:hypothetical protein
MSSRAGGVVVSELRSALDGLGAVDVAAMPAAALGADIAELIEARHRLDGQIQRRIGVFDAQGMSEVDAAPSTASWLRGRCRLAPGEASARVKTARLLRELPMVATALAEGEISFDHARAVALLAHETDVADTRRVQRQLVDVARLTDPVRFAGELRAIRDALRDQDTRAKDEAAAFDRRELSVTPVLDGFNIRGWLPDEAGSLVKTVLDALAAPLPGETRNPAQRNADALVEVFRRSADGGDLPTNHGVRPHLFAIGEFDALLDAETGAMAQLGYGGRISPTATQRIACDAAITRILISPGGQPLDVGRATRVVSAAQWKALVVRDGGCVFPGCDRPAAWCQAHHYRLHWTHGGPSDLDNLALVCGYHHRLLHEGQWALRLHQQHWLAIRPDGTHIPGQRIGYRNDNASAIADAILNRPRGPCQQ